jgi:hypothetical protein
MEPAQVPATLFGQPRSLEPPLQHDRLIAALNTLSDGTLKEFKRQKSVLEPCFSVLEHPAIASAFSLGGREGAFFRIYTSKSSQEKPLLTALAAAVNRGLSLVADLLSSSSSQSGSGGSSNYPKLLTQLPAVACVRSFCGILLAALRQISPRLGAERQSPVKVAVLARTSG